MTKPAKPKLSELAARISAHLKRIEYDPKVNVARNREGCRPYFGSRTWSGSRYVYVCYVSYQGGSRLTRDEAEKYLAWLDSGKVGKHWVLLGR